MKNFRKCKVLKLMMIVMLIMLSGCSEKIVEVRLAPEYWAVFFHVGSVDNRIADALIQMISNEDNNVKFTGTTDLMGIATFTNVRQGAYTIIVSAPDFVTYTQVVNILGSTNQFSIWLAPLKISGSFHIHNIFDEGLAGASIRLINVEDASMVYEGLTDAHGAFFIENRIGGIYNIIINAEGFETHSRFLNLHRNNFRDTIRLTSVNAMGLIAVRGYNTGNIEGAIVQLVNRDDSNIRYIEITDINGQARFRDIGRGVYDMSVTHEGFQPFNSGLSSISGGFHGQVTLLPI